MVEQKKQRIAMWSGPRNISTAMMRSWENRADTQVVDEPFYACYLNATGIIHPMQSEVLASQSSNWDQVISGVLQSTLEPSVSIQYQKHMTHHMVGNLDMDWFNSVRHAFLIRHPAEVVASYAKKREGITAEDLGFENQNKIFELALSAGSKNIPIIDAKDVLSNPRKALTLLCDALDLPFDKGMLNWPTGKRDTDGVWSAHWYQNVEKSTGFSPYSEKLISLNSDQQKIVNECLPFYERMHKLRINI